MGIGQDLASGISTVVDIGESGIIISAPVGEVVTDSLLAWWKHDEGSGVVLNDYFGGFDGDIVGGAFWLTNGPDGNPVGRYDGLSEFVKGIGQGLDIPSGGITLVAALNSYDSPVTVHRSLISKRDDIGTNTNFALDLNNGSDEVRFYYEDGGGWQVYVTTDFNFVAQTWYIVTLTFTYGTGASMKIYKNLTLCNGGWTVGDGSGGPGGADAFVFIGAENASGDGETGALLHKGLLGDILIYNRILTLPEITANYDVLKGRYRL